ncbi:hypothetical protein SNE40_014821 [Patella caerulea]|uniref:RCC1-like domain-containing protein n=1 Tax=Patella caerulea TaxID=87958 RepID=A0AAN8JHQ6_PATCE
MYELFDVAKLLSVRKDNVTNSETSDINVGDSNSTNTPSPSPEKVFIKRYAWREEGEKCLLAVYCSNDYLLLRYKPASDLPIIKQIPWPKVNTIVSLCFDPTLVWLLVLTESPDIYIIPALCLLEPKARVNQLWTTNDATLIPLSKPAGVVTKICWWHTWEDDQIAIYGTKEGEIIFVDLLRRKIVTSKSVNGCVIDLDIVQDDQQMTTSLLITGNSGNQWKLLLESSSPQRWTPLNDVSAFGADKRLPIVKNILVKSEEGRSMFTPVKFQQFDRSVILYPQNAKGRHFITAHCDKTSTYQVYDSCVEHSPFFIYKLPIGTYDVILTDSIIFAVSSIHGQRLLVISNQKAEISSEDQQDFNKDAILQKFEMPHGEKVLGTEKKSFPFYWHEKAEAASKQEGGDSSVNPSLQSIPIRSHTVLDGCIIVTNSSVFECRPRTSPERLFIKLAVENSDAAIAESLGISIGLNLSNLFELAADYLLEVNQASQALNLYHISKCSYLKRVTSLLKHKYYSEAMTLLQRVLGNSHIELNTAERKHMSDLALRCYIHQIGSRQNESTEFLQDFRTFLLGSFSFDEKIALELLAEYGFIEQILDFAKARGLVMEALDLLQCKGRYNIPLHLLEDLISRGFHAHLLKAGEGTFIQCLCSEDLVKLLLVKPQLAIKNIHLLEKEITNLDEDLLSRLAEVFDPSKQVMQGFLKRKSRSRQRTTSLNSLTSFIGEQSEIMMINDNIDIYELVEFFLRIVLLLNNRRQLNSTKPLDIHQLLTNWDFDYTELKENISSQKKPKLALQCSLIGGGPDHGAAVRNGDLYTWGRAKDGRLGHGDLVSDRAICTPCRVETLHMLQIKVSSVSCGEQHTMAITQQGVYGWGSSMYGQVGVGTRHTYTRPMLLETFLELGETVVAIECGQYHTLALLENTNVYSWGWGVHGQLGHNDPEDQLVPKNIKSLCGKDIIRIGAGYCHSLFLSANGDIYTSGCAYFGQLGIGDNIKRTKPVVIEGIPEGVIAISTKYFHSVAITANNHVYSWGCHPYSLRFSAHSMKRSRQHGQPMIDPIQGFLNPVLVDTSFVNGKLIQVACGSFHNVALTTDGDVYVWGRNVDGQLGIGHKIEEKIPVMLTKINDHQFISAKSGGEYTIALDSDYQVWVWGKNESGQLGLPMVKSKPIQSVKRSSPNYKRHGAGSTQAVGTPSILTKLPSHDTLGQTSWKQGLFASSDNSDSDLWVSEYYGEDCELYRLPDLGTIGTQPYCSRTIPVVLKHMPSYCNSLTTLRLAVDIGDWQTAADINILNHNYSQALSCHLLLLSKIKDISKEEFCDISVDVIEKHFSVLICDNIRDDIKERDIHSMCIEIIQYWEKWDLPVVKLEEIFINHMSYLSSSLSQILFQNSDGKNGQTKVKSSSASFSTKFNLQVLDRLLQNDSTSGDTDETLAKWISLIGLDNLDERDQSENYPELQPAHKLIPYDRLWTDIIQNLQKHLGDRLCVSVTRSELDYLDQTIDSSEEQHQSAFFFTCGHNHPKQIFYQDVLSYFERELNSGATKLPYSATLLSQYYKRQGCLPMACPKCVLNAIWTIS